MNSSPHPRAGGGVGWLLPSLVGLVLLAVFLHAAAPVTTNDAYWHVKTGERLFEVGGFPATDSFSYTATDRPWFLHEWLTQVTFYGVWWLGDLYGLRLLTGLAAVAIGLLVYRLFRRELGRAGGIAALLGPLLFLLLGGERLQTRPTLFTILFFCVAVMQLTRPGGRWSWRWAAGMVLLTVTWVNMHSVGLLMPVLYGTWLAGEAIKVVLAGKGARAPWAAGVDTAHLRRHGLTFAAVAAATLATPSGIGLYGFAFQDKSAVMRFIGDEWAPFHLSWSANEHLTFSAYLTILLCLGFLLATYFAAGVVLSRAKGQRVGHPALPDPSRALLLVLCVCIGLSARRFHWALCPAVALALGWIREAALAGTLPLARPRLKPALRGLAAFTCLVGMVAAYQGPLRYQARLPLHTIVASPAYLEPECAFFELPAVAFLRDAELTGNLFSHYGSGGILSYHLHPALAVFIDSRIDLYGREIYLEYLAVASGRPDQRAILDRWQTDLHYRHWDLAPLTHTAGWTLIYRGTDGEIFLRDWEDDRNAENLARCQHYYAAHAIPFSPTTGLATSATPTGR